jgi:trehalose 6-phosphate phosphatase
MTHSRAAAFLFGRSAPARLADFVDPATLFAFDLDGTLAPIVSDPALIRIPDAVQRALAELAGRAPVAINTGRTRSAAHAHLAGAPPTIAPTTARRGLPAIPTFHENLSFTRAQGSGSTSTPPPS